MPIINKFNIEQKVSSYLAFLFLLVMSFLVAWFVIDKAENVIESASSSETFDTQKRFEIDVKK